jgi:hypothetical protein
MTTTADLTTSAYLPTDGAFQVFGGALYRLRPATLEQAEALGVPGVNTVLVGRTGYLLGTATPETGRVVRQVPGLRSRRGVLNTFVAGDVALRGYVVVE